MVYPNIDWSMFWTFLWVKQSSREVDDKNLGNRLGPQLKNPIHWWWVLHSDNSNSYQKLASSTLRIVKGLSLILTSKIRLQRISILGKFSLDLQTPVRTKFRFLPWRNVDWKLKLKWRASCLFLRVLGKLIKFCGVGTLLVKSRFWGSRRMRMIDIEFRYVVFLWPFLSVVLSFEMSLVSCHSQFWRKLT